MLKQYKRTLGQVDHTTLGTAGIVTVQNIFKMGTRAKDRYKPQTAQVFQDVMGSRNFLTMENRLVTMGQLFAGEIQIREAVSPGIQGIGVDWFRRAFAGDIGRDGKRTVRNPMIMEQVETEFFGNRQKVDLFVQLVRPAVK